jgi:maltooligosyltrehalose synthase
MAITCVPRLIGSLIPDAASPPLGSTVWKDTKVELPAAAQADSETFRDAFTGAFVVPERTNGVRTIAAATLFERFPVALLVPSNLPSHNRTQQ